MLTNNVKVGSIPNENGIPSIVFLSLFVPVPLLVTAAVLTSLSNKLNQSKRSCIYTVINNDNHDNFVDPDK